MSARLVRSLKHLSVDRGVEFIVVEIQSTKPPDGDRREAVNSRIGPAQMQVSDLACQHRRER